MNVKFEPDEVKIQNLLDNYRDKKKLDKYQIYYQYE